MTIVDKFKTLKFEPFAVSELEKRTLTLAEELDKLKKDMGYIKGELWVTKQKLKEK
jgi:hypothetical protein